MQMSFFRFLRQTICIALSCSAGLALLAGCEDNDGDGVTDMDATIESLKAQSTSSKTTTNKTSTTVYPQSYLFPDGLHPNELGDQIIAAAFNDKVAKKPTNIGNNFSNTIVCIGDSITESGYPPYLAKMSGKKCINAGIGGSNTGSGAGRVDNLLTSYKPAYLCVLYGANDVIQGKPASYTIDNLKYMCNAAKNRQTIPLLATLTPMSGKKYGKYNKTVQSLNQQIRSLAKSSGYKLVDLEKEFYYISK